MQVNQILMEAMQVAKSQHKHTAIQIAQYNNLEVEHLSRVDFGRVLSDSLQQPQKSTDSLIIQNSQYVSRDYISLDQLTAEALDSSGKYKVLTEMLNRRLGLMSIAVSGQER
ncbi:hypothetical protein GCM10007978_01520 [Shewanella hanedai]|uniref:Uncharacterized protein n=1 Tax=Shewanella hanedai TaxID=25 RepID=A0A553JUY7_SHEHA|nr:hypothetical protein [Shewanella hanedai]TRY16264.1 hypothetical protein FN961_01150 [Shewanella hanedai]GGI67572.1 hypothetical protein GCM10007978_01520 [Shewanella hanedai]